MRLFVIASLTVFIGLFSLNNAQANRDPLEGAHFEIQEVAPTAAELVPELSSRGMNVTDVPAVDEFSQMMVIGRQIFDVIKAGEPVVNIQRDTFSVVPAGITEWNQLHGWEAPVTRVYNVNLVNGLHRSMVELRLKISAVPGGQLNGKGHYLANVIIVPTLIQVGWGVKLDVWSEAQKPVNVGTLSDPIAAIGVDVRFKAKTLLNEVNGTQDYFIRGDGNVMTVSSFDPAN